MRIVAKSSGRHAGTVHAFDGHVAACWLCPLSDSHGWRCFYSSPEGALELLRTHLREVHDLENISVDRDYMTGFGPSVTTIPREDV